MQLRPYQNKAKNNVVVTTVGQVIAPTGTGKSVIQGAIFEYAIKIREGFGIYVILTPRIMLTNQLMKDVGTQLMKSGIELRTLTVHSGKAADFLDADPEIDHLAYVREMNAISRMGMKVTTHGDEAATAMKEAMVRQKPLLVCCTYDSSPALCKAIRILQEDHKDLKIDNVLCDEAHYIVEKQFFNNVAEVKKYTNNIHFFTATQKVTGGDSGNGMNNTDFYGPVVFRARPLEMIQQGWMVRPRIHYERAEAGAPWPTMVKDAFEEHQTHVSYNAKMLVCCDGSKTIQEITTSPGFTLWAKENSITVFSISSAFGCWINQTEVDRNRFLSRLKAHTGKAVILHINILTEGIDVPDITGVMFIRNMGTTRFLQSLGRATRVHKDDFGKPTDNFTESSKLWRKPYAWAIVSERDGDNLGTASNLANIIGQMRLADFNPTEEVVIAIDRAKKKREEIDLNNEKDPKVQTNFAELFDIQHDIEVEKLAALEESDLNAACPI